jgi:putative tryptophan/tyrosine transport system substrate-binding protein
MRRREFISLMGGAVASWPLAALAQEPEKVRRIGVLSNRGADDPEVPAFLETFTKGLAESGWTDGRNVRIDYRWTAGEAVAAQKYAAELIALGPDVILASGTLSVGSVKKITSSVPIVFTLVTDPVGAGFVDSLSLPGGNTTGFMLLEYSSSGKWLELLKLIAPKLTRVAVLRDTDNPAGSAQFGAIQSVAPSLAVAVSPINTNNANDIERSVAAFASTANGGLIVTGSATATVHRKLIIALAARYKLPAIYTTRFQVALGGLISYGPDYLDQFRRAAGYIDRILKGEKPGDLPVQAPTKYELVINLKTAKALGLDVPATLLARADEVIE